MTNTKRIRDLADRIRNKNNIDTEDVREILYAISMALDELLDRENGK